ncbi:MAG: hypothetical protein AABX82_04405, partial [Nanoarchaeota archaeon]
MTVDLTLTREKALAEIGALVVDDYPEIRLLPREYVGIEQSVTQGVYDISFTIHEGSAIMQNMKIWREAQIKHGFASPEEIAVGNNFSSARNIGIFPDYDWEQKQGWTRMQLFYESDHMLGAANVHFEVLSNALEHGSKFGARGPVTVRFQGGTEGALIEITDPGRGRLTAPLTIEQMVDRLARAGRTFEKQPTSYSDFVYPQFTADSSMYPLNRGMGSINATVGKPVVSDCTTDEGYT